MATIQNMDAVQGGARVQNYNWVIETKGVGEACTGSQGLIGVYKPLGQLIKTISNFLITQVVHPFIMDIIIGALHQLCTEWSAQHKATQQKTLALLKWLLDIDSLLPATSIMSKSLIIQLHQLVNHESSLSREVALDSEQVKFLLTSLSSAPSDHISFHCTINVMQVIGYLVRYAPNKEALINGGILDHLADLVEGGCSEQQCATELICFIMDQPELNIRHEQSAQTSTNSYLITSGLIQF